MKKQLIIMLFVLASVPISYGQQRTVKQSQKSATVLCRKPLLNAGRPAVYLTFLTKETIKPSEESEDPNKLFFKLTNNTCWPIYLRMSGVADDRYGDASLYYLVENSNTGQEQSGSLNCHVCSVNAIGSGRSIVFSMPLREVDREAIMRIKYEFKWERDAKFGDYENSNTMHTVAYYFEGLPETVLPKRPSGGWIPVRP